MKARHTTHRTKGMTLFEVLVVIAVVVLVAAMVLPMLARPKRHSGINCVNLLKQNAIAFRVWEGDNGDKYPMDVSVTNGGAMELAAAGDAAGIFRVMSNELSTPRVLICPEDEKHFYATNFSTDFNNSKISYFIGLDATEGNPQNLLVGDDNLAVGGTPVKPGILNLATNAPVTWTIERHKFGGNFALTDGSVQQTTSAGLNAAVASSTVTNLPVVRLVIP
jgi:prepilin-type N-terminal cleavage/methylation domain-containing protein/prepilin-type processing-associated H-X9-DG protein